jgi:GT2 family glycosyltransferase
METSIDCKYDISIIIPNYRSERYLKNNLASVYDKIIPETSCEAIVVNNDEKESLAEIKNKFPDIRIIDHKKNIGFGAANNLGAKIAQGRYLFFLNPDSEIMSNNINQIIDEFKADENIGVIGSQLLEDGGKIQKWSAGREISIANIIRNNLGISGSRKIWQSKNPIEADWVAGTAMFIRKELFEEVGRYDEIFFMYFEDMDLCRRIKKAGKKILYFPAFKVLHKSGGSYGDKRFQKKHYYDSQEYYFKKNRPGAEHLCLKLLRRLFLK